MRRVLLICAALLLVASACSADESSTETASTEVTATTVTSTTVATQEVVMDRDVEYGSDERHRLDVVYREGLVGAPTVLVIHGGGWNSGDKSSEHTLATFFAERGLVAATPNYRLVEGEGVNAFPVPVNDVACAAAWLAANADEYGGDASTMVVTGYSAGGHLAAMLALASDTDWLEDCPVGDVELDFDALVGFAGVYSFDAKPSGSAVCSFLYPLIGGWDPACLDGEPYPWAPAEPVAYADSNDPPVLLVQGTLDRIVARTDSSGACCTSQVDVTAAVLEDQGVAVDLVMVPDGGHGDVGILMPPVAWAVADFIASVGIPISDPPLNAEEAEPVAWAEQGASVVDVWYTSSSHPLVFRDDGTWSLLAKVVGLPWTWGTYTVDGDVLTLTTADDATLLCEGTTATYEVKVSETGEQISLLAMDDPCQARESELEGGPYRPVPNGLVPGNL